MLHCFFFHLQEVLTPRHRLLGHQRISSSIQGGIAYSSSSNINYNPGGALAIGYGVGFVCSISQTHVKRWINKNGIIDSNSVIFNFLIPSFFAAVFSAFMQGIGEGDISGRVYTVQDGSTIVASTTTTYRTVSGSNRNFTQQGGFQMVGWCLSVGFGLVGGLIIGLLFKCINTFEEPGDFFVDRVLFENDARPNRKVEKEKKDDTGESGRNLEPEGGAQEYAKAQ